MTVTFEMLIGFVGGVVGILSVGLVFWNTHINAKKRYEAEAETRAELTSALEYLRRGFDDLKRILETLTSKLEVQNEKIIKVEESTKSAHKRIDELGKITR